MMPVSDSAPESPLFAESPVIVCRDPLAEFLGVGDGTLHYRFDDVVRLSGHACPTVAGAFLLVKRAFAELYDDGEVPERGGLRITVYGPAHEGVNGPISQVFTLLTGAAADNGFHGIAGSFARDGLLRFAAPDEGSSGTFTFERHSNGRRVTLAFDSSPVLGSSRFRQGAQGLVGVRNGLRPSEERPHFSALWREGVELLLADAGVRTVQVVHH